MPTGQPITQRLESQFAAQGTAATTGSTVIGEVQANGQVTAVTLTPNTTITGVATNNRVFTVTNRGQAGAGNTAVASVTFGAGTNAPASDEFNVPITNANVAENDVLSLDETVNGTGMAHGGGRVQVEVARSS
jgi:hypothetical protein